MRAWHKCGNTVGFGALMVVSSKIFQIQSSLARQILQVLTAGGLLWVEIIKSFGYVFAAASCTIMGV